MWIYAGVALVIVIVILVIGFKKITEIFITVINNKW